MSRWAYISLQKTPYLATKNTKYGVLFFVCLVKKVIFQLSNFCPTAEHLWDKYSSKRQGWNRVTSKAFRLANRHKHTHLPKSCKKYSQCQENLFFFNKTVYSSSKIFLTRPTMPESSFTFMPCGWFDDLVKIRLTIPSVVLPVLWSFFCTTSTSWPIRIFFLFLASTLKFCMIYFIFFQKKIFCILGLLQLKNIFKFHKYIVF